MDKWKIINVKKTEWEQDKSGFYCIINVVSDNAVRLDVLTSNHSPAISFQGEAADVRKYAMKYAEKQGWPLSLEHAAYIGYELARAEMLGEDYVQD